MLSQLLPSFNSLQALTRRELLRVGAVSLLAPFVSGAVRADSAPLRFAPAKTVILLWMDGGLSHLDTFDPKHRADCAIRGPFGAVATNEDEVQISDGLPRLARQADKFAILRGVSHGEGGHERAACLMRTGFPLTSNSTIPDFGSLLLEAQTAAPFTANSKPARTRVERESEARYGASAFGRACLAARRKAEQGVPFICVPMSGWDLHSDCFSRLQNYLLPTLDTGFSALLLDLAQRGLLESTLVICMGEFGRSPVINANQKPGRDHWPAAMSVVLAGGGVAGGQILGATDALGLMPLETAIRPQDVLATILHLAGVPIPCDLENSGRILRELCK